MEEVMLESITQFGLAGLMGALWILERRHSGRRERQLSEAHDRLLQQKGELSELMTVVRDNSTAMTALERSQARLITVGEEIIRELRGGPRSARSGLAL